MQIPRLALFDIAHNRALEMASRDGSSAASEDCDRESVDSDEEDEWDDWAVTAENEEPEDAESVQCLFCSEIRSSAASIFNHCLEQHSFDFVKLRRDHQLEFYDCLRLINFIRSEVLCIYRFYLMLLANLTSDLPTHHHSSAVFERISRCGALCLLNGNYRCCLTNA